MNFESVEDLESELVDRVAERTYYENWSRTCSEIDLTVGFFIIHSFWPRSHK